MSELESIDLSGKTSEEALALLDEKTPEIEEQEEVKIEEEPKEESEEIKLEEEPEKEIELKTEDDDLDGLINRINRQKLLKDFPELEKKYPQLLKAYYGNLEYRKLFPTLSDVKEAHSKLTEFEKIETELSGGSSESLLKGLKEKSPEGFTKTVDNYLNNLRQVDEQAYYHVIGNNIKGAIVAMADAADKMKNDDLLTAAKFVNQFFFGGEKFEPPSSFKANEKNPEVDKLNEEKTKFAQERLVTRQTELNEKVDSIIDSTITKNIDPKDELSPYVKKQAIREANELVKKLISQDKEFQDLINRSWKKAEKENFSPELTSKIKEAFISKARVILPPVIKKIRNDANQGVKGVKDTSIDRKGPLAQRGASNSSSSKREPKELPRGATTLERLNAMMD